MGIMKLTEGKTYKFGVEKSIIIEGVDFFLLSGPDKKRFLLKKEYYPVYNIQVKQMINCRIDKINCMGEIFLEPEHPYYAEGKSYDFEIVRSEDRVDKNGMQHQVIIVRDHFGSELSVTENIAGAVDFTGGGVLNLKILRIEKGSIHFSDVDESGRTEKEEDGRIYDFIIQNRMKGLDGEIYLILCDSDGNEHCLQERYYKHYGLKPGIKFPGRFISYNSGDTVRVEPENPFFKPGSVYKFRVKEIISINDSQDKIIIMTDKFGFSHKVVLEKDVIQSEMISMRVERIRKGWPILEQI